MVVAHNRTVACPFFLIDAFCTDRFESGNTAAVVLLKEGWPDDQRLQAIATKFNQSETAFIGFDSSSPSQRRLRWFSPTVEVGLCGHATLAALTALYETNEIANGYLTNFDTVSGVVSGVSLGPNAQIDFPYAVLKQQSLPVDQASFFRSPVWTGLAGPDWMVVLPSEDDVRTFSMPRDQIMAMQMRGLIVTARSSMPHRSFVSRFFGPNVGIDEDPVTGSAHCALIPYWSKELGLSTVAGEQLSARGGYIEGSFTGSRVLLRGRTRPWARGALEIDPD